ncbi:MAG TPA: zinc ABC transporter substrate-binding protein [Pirellulales bacterium]|nr:zinc ABC transporter substrate-binding protein [Pirellulales bacterium]
MLQSPMLPANKDICAMREMTCSTLLLVLVVSLTGCHEQADGAANVGQTATAAMHFSGKYPLRVVVTTGMVADLVGHVGGSFVEVTPLMGEGVDPHLYKASTGDVARLGEADAVFYSGLHLEGRMGDVLSRLANRKPTFAATDLLDRDRLLKVGPEQFDPHVWFDVALWSECLTQVEQALAGYDPPHAADYRRQAAVYRDELASLDAWCREQMAAIPTERRALVTAHDAFHYFGRAYDIEVEAIQGISTQAEAGVSQINDLVDLISRRKIKAVFVETSVSERNIRALVEGCAARGHRVEIGGQLFSDAMGKPGTPEGTYMGMVRHNVETIRRALQ